MTRYATYPDGLAALPMIVCRGCKGDLRDTGHGDLCVSCAMPGYGESSTRARELVDAMQKRGRGTHASARADRREALPG